MDVRLMCRDVPDIDVDERSNDGGYPELRPLMFSIAYRMVGSVSEAEDIVQDAYLRLQRGGQLAGAGGSSQPPDRVPVAHDPGQGGGAEPVRSPEAFAATITTRLAIDHLRSARTRREAYVGPWLPEPLLTDADADPAYQIERDEMLSMAFLVLLERLSPVERAVFVLREVFQYEYEEIAEIVGKEPGNCRQIMARARRHIEDQRPRFEASPQRRRELAQQFLAALNDGDVVGLERLLAQDVAFYGDGGGKAPAIKTPIFGRSRVARFLIGLARQAAEMGVQLELVEVNGQPGLRALDTRDQVVTVLGLDVVDGAIAALRNVLNPDKLQHLGPVGDLAIMMGERGGEATPGSGQS
jgi:RNA polymerase sigma-70 factor (ECF subfamily)